MINVKRDYEAQRRAEQIRSNRDCACAYPVLGRFLFECLDRCSLQAEPFKALRQLAAQRSDRLARLRGRVYRVNDQ